MASVLLLVFEFEGTEACLRCGYSGGSSCSSTLAGTFKHMVLVAGDDGDDGDDDDDDAAAHLGNMLRCRLLRDARCGPRWQIGS